MWNLLKSELLKLRRCQILWVGLVALALCPLVQYGSQLIVEPEYRNPNYDFPMLFANVVWGNTQMFFPISLVMIGSWLIDRESTHDTLKNIMTIPVSMPDVLGAKLFWVGILTVLLGIYSVGVTLITGLAVGLSGLTAEVFFHGGTQIVLAGLTTYMVCLYAPNPDFWTDPRGISGRFHSGVLPWIQHDVFQRRHSCQHLSVFCCTAFSGL